MYVGQSNNVARRLKEHARKYGQDSISNIKVRKMPNSSRLDRLEAEQARINLYRQNGTALENKINAIKQN
jgi:predicted GIY-YIG superfamily endonuclease